MNKEHEDYFIKTYPSLFPPEDIRTDPMQSCMCWRMECGDGWFNLLDKLFKKIVATGFDVTLAQVKEKFGTLRVYLNSFPEGIDVLINEAEAESEVTCEVCGSPGKLYTDGWYTVRCDKCKK